MPGSNELFLISDEAWEASSPAEVSSVCKDLKELGLYALPYPKVDIGVSVDKAIVFMNKSGQLANKDGCVEGKAVPPFGPDFFMIYKDISLTSSGQAEMSGSTRCFPSGRVRHISGIQAEIVSNYAVESLRDLLICLLATRNVEKVRVENKLFRLGIGKKKGGASGYRYVTTIGVPQILDADKENPPQGRKVCPHLRRGHIRRQHFGPSSAEHKTGQFVKSIWIAPCFVNADEGFVAKRERYNLHLGEGSVHADHE